MPYKRRTIKVTRAARARGRALVRRMQSRNYRIPRPIKAPRLFRKPVAGRQSLVVPLKVGYSYTVAGTGSSPAVDIRDPSHLSISLKHVPTDWFNRYNPMFQWIRINKARIEVTTSSNIGQYGVTNSSLYRIWSKRLSSSAENSPDNVQEWMNMQSAKRSVFSGRHTAANFYFTPAFEAPQGATIAKRLMYKQWFEVPNGTAGCVDHLGILAQIRREDNANLATTEKFNVNVTLYCQVKGVKEL